MLAQGAVERRDLVADSSEVPGDLFGQGEDLGEASSGTKPPASTRAISASRASRSARRASRRPMAVGSESRARRLTCVEMVSRRDCVATGRGRPLRTRKRMAASAGADSS